MQFLMLVCREAPSSPNHPTEADRAAAPDVAQWWQAAVDAGQHVMGDRLRPAAQAVTVRVRGGEALVSQGPFTETSELVAGFDVLECASLEEAIEVASGHAMAYGGAIELRPMWPMDEE